MRKIGNKYYFIYSSENSHELCYAVGEKADGDFRYGGTLVSIGDVFLDGRKREDALNYLGNTHGSIECINGNYYVFYHRQTNLNQFSRQACAERITIKPDGSIMQAEITSCGLNDGPLAGCGVYGAYIACNLRSGNGIFAYSMVKPENTEHPYITQETPDYEEKSSQYIANMRNGSIAGFKYFTMDGANKISATVRCSGSGTLRISTKSDDDTVAQLEIISNSEWYEISAALTPLYGKYAFYFVYSGNGSMDFKQFTIS
jgi:hypothetical protein